MAGRSRTFVCSQPLFGISSFFFMFGEGEIYGMIMESKIVSAPFPPDDSLYFEKYTNMAFAWNTGVLS